MASAVEEQNVPTGEVMQSIRDTANGSTEVASMTETMCGAAGQTRSTSEDVLKNASELSSQRIRLQESIQKFLKEVRVG